MHFTSKKSLVEAKSNLWLSKQIRAFQLAVALLFVTSIFGTVGYMAVEGWSLHDAVYMTVITLSTVGYGEVKPLSTEGEVFTIALIVLGVMVAAYSIGIIGRTALEGELYRFRGIAKMYKKIAGFNNHIILCGYGRLGKFITPDIIKSGSDIVVIEHDPMTLVELETLGVPFIEGNAYDDEVLIQAGVERASALLALLPSDSDNVFITLSARALNENIRILARTEQPHTETKLKQAGANHVFSPYRVSASRVTQQLLHPNVSDFLQIKGGDQDRAFVVEQIKIPEGSPVLGKTIESLSLENNGNMTIAACSDASGNLNLRPQDSTVLESGCTLIALGLEDAVKSFTDLIENGEKA